MAEKKYAINKKGQMEMSPDEYQKMRDRPYESLALSKGNRLSSEDIKDPLYTNYGKRNRELRYVGEGSPEYGGYDAGAGRGKQGGPTAKQLESQNTPAWVNEAKQAAKDAEDQPKLDRAYEKSRTTDYAKGGKVSSASSRADGIAQRGKTRGKIVMCGGGMYKK